MSDLSKPADSGSANSDCDKDAAARSREAIRALVAQAIDRGEAFYVADAMMEAVARIIYRTGNMGVAGDAMRRIGGYLCTLMEAHEAGSPAEPRPEGATLQ